MPLGEGRAGVFSLVLNFARNSLGGVCSGGPPRAKRGSAPNATPARLAALPGRGGAGGMKLSHASQLTGATCRSAAGHCSQQCCVHPRIPLLGSTSPSIPVSTLVSVRQCDPPYCAQTTHRELGHPGCTFE